ncbi:MAG: methyltransferase domain-containing protein [Planctomycetota bacterium]|nr:MAG: methyltransferase domain-containing protein [Planctomycetota bacterium]
MIVSDWHAWRIGRMILRDSGAAPHSVRSAGRSAKQEFEPMLRSTRLIRAALAGLLAIIAGCENPKRNAAAASAPHEASVAPGINKAYEHPDVERFKERFESESREVYDQRERIVADLGLSPGDSVADIGAGTGFYSILFGQAVGPGGKVYAVDIAPEFIEHIRKRAAAAGLKNITPVVCKEDSVELPPDSVDVAFICDTYHHFEYPRSTLASLRRALRAGGEVVVIDFIRKPGVSREWVLNHVRAGKRTVIREFDEAGFDLVADGAPSAELAENYFLRFRKGD